MYVNLISSCLIHFIIKDYDSRLQSSERLQLRVCSVEANEPSLENRHIKSGMQYATKLKAYPSNPAHDRVF